MPLRLLGFLFLLFLISPALAIAVTPAISYQGVILNPDKTPLKKPSVDFEIKIVVANTDCAVFIENHNDVDVSTGDGSFHLLIGRGQKVGTNTIALKDIFSPTLTIPETTSNCTAGYTKSPNDVLQMEVSFDDGNGIQRLKPIDLTTSPMAFETFNVGGVPSTNVLRFTDTMTAPLPAGKWTELLALLNGSSNNYLKNSGEAITIAAGGTNQNVTITPSGSGATLIGGNVGIGTTSPSQTLDVSGTARITGATDIGGGSIHYDPTGYANKPLVTLGKSAASSFLINVLDTGSFQIRRQGGNFGPEIRMGSSWGTLETPTLSTSGQYIGTIGFEAYTGAGTGVNGYTPGASIFARSSSDSSATNSAANLYFATTADGSTSPVSRMVVSTNGNVGIGTDSPTTKLEVNGTMKVNGAMRTLTNLNLYVDPLKADDTGDGFTLATAKKTIGAALNLADAVASHRISIMIANTSASTRAQIGASASLSNKSIQISADHQDTVYINWDAGITVDNVSMRFGLLGWERGCDVLVNTSIMFYTDSGFFHLNLNNGGANLITFNANNQAMFWQRYLNNATGNTRIIGDIWYPGISSIIAGSGVTGSKIIKDNYSGQHIYVEGNVRTNFIDSSVDTTGVYFERNISSLMNGNVGIGVTAPTYQLQLSSDSAAKPGTSTWTIASDRRLKDIRAPFERGLDALEGLHPIYFRYKQDNPLQLPSTKEYVGIIAQDAALAVPESVDTDDKGYMHVTNDAIIWTLLNAVKELSHKISHLFDEQERSIASLNAKADKLEIENALLKANDRAKEERIFELERRLEKIEHELQKK